MICRLRHWVTAESQFSIDGLRILGDEILRIARLDMA
jgi:hypothetical protein